MPVHYTRSAADCRAMPMHPALATIFDADEFGQLLRDEAARPDAPPDMRTQSCNSCRDAYLADFHPDAGIYDDTPDYQQGWSDGKAKAHSEIRNAAHSPLASRHHPHCNCEVCQTINAVIAAYRAGRVGDGATYGQPFTIR